MIRTILFDLDDTLYPRSAGIMGEIRRLILDFVQTRLGLSPEKADALRDRYLKVYGTTMRGLQVNHQIDPGEYLHHVHEIALSEYLQANSELDAVLEAISQVAGEPPESEADAAFPAPVRTVTIHFAGGMAESGLRRRS